MGRLTRKLPPEARLAYLIGVAIAAAVLDGAPAIVALAAVQAILWFADGLGFGPLLRTAKRLVLFVAIVFLSYAFVSLGEAARDSWRAVALGPWSVEINLAGLAEAGIMSLRVIALVLASGWVRLSGAPGDLVAGLRKLRVPAFLALAIDATLGLLADGGGPGSGGGRGRGGGTGRGETALDFAALRAGRLGFVERMIDRWLARAEAAVGAAPGIAAGQARDVAIIVGMAGAILALKAVQVLPGLPFASGHKNLLVVPFLLLAAGLTRMRFGGLWTGITAGTVSVLLGYGKFGVLEIAHVAAPGLLADLLLPLARLDGPRWWRLAQFAVIGALLGLARFAANLLVILLAGAPGLAFAFYAPMLASQLVFGALSALVSLAVLGRLAPHRRPEAEHEARHVP